jgi:hypothetical protein
MLNCMICKNDEILKKYFGWKIANFFFKSEKKITLNCMICENVEILKP